MIWIFLNKTLRILIISWIYQLNNKISTENFKHHLCREQVGLLIILLNLVVKIQQLLLIKLIKANLLILSRSIKEIKIRMSKSTNKTLRKNPERKYLRKEVDHMFNILLTWLFLTQYHLKKSNLRKRNMNNLLRIIRQQTEK